ncbi:MAG TPA: response regulator transcription factor [Clostridiales bacterium]|nr:response regulator transcription factor [Clostridiales bacterium]
MLKQIYLVEDEKSLNLLLKKYLEIEGYEVITFSDGMSALSRIHDLPDLWVLDIMLPDIDGYEIIRSIKEFKEDTPVIFMSARNEELDRVVGLELGSDDYLSKPFLPRELVIRVNRLFERMYGKEDTEIDDIIIVADYSISINQRTVNDQNKEIQLTNKEFELLLYIAQNKNIVVTREQILMNIWGFDYYGSERVVDNTIRRLRKKMDKLNIETLYGYGYKLVTKV